MSNEFSWAIDMVPNKVPWMHIHLTLDIKQMNPFLLSATTILESPFIALLVAQQPNFKKINRKYFTQGDYYGCLVRQGFSISGLSRDGNPSHNSSMNAVNTKMGYMTTNTISTKSNIFIFIGDTQAVWT